MTDDERQREPAKAVGSSLLSMSGHALSAALWICLIWAVYLKLPRYKQVLLDFGTDVGPLTAIVLNYAGLMLPVIGIAAGVCLTANRSRRIRAFVLFWFPLMLIAGLVFAVGPPFVKLLNDLD